MLSIVANQFINIYEKLFNIIFDKGFVPHIWLIGIIKPIYKNKGDIYEPKNVVCACKAAVP
jgi:hypothetical protein